MRSYLYSSGADSFCGLMTNLEKSRSLWVGRGLTLLAPPSPLPAFPPQPASPGPGPDRKLHKGIQLLAGELGVGKALQVDDERLRQHPQVQLLGGQLVLLAIGAVPRDGARVRTQTLSEHLPHALCAVRPSWATSRPEMLLLLLACLLL